VIHQVIVVRLQDRATDIQRQELAAALRGLQDEIPFVRAMRMGFDLHLRPGNHDFGITVDFDTVNDYLAYREHPAHERVVAECIRPILLERAGTVFEST
jgi:hypothetical protein